MASVAKLARSEEEDTEESADEEESTVTDISADDNADDPVVE